MSNKGRRKFKMTRQRAQWVGNRETTLRSEPMRVNEAFANRGADEAQKMVRKMHLDVSKQVEALFDTTAPSETIMERPSEITTESVAMDASISVKSRHLINKLTRKWNERFANFSDSFADKMTSGTELQTANDLKKATDKLSGGVTIKTDSLSDRTKDIIYSATDESTSLLKSISVDYMSEVKEMVSRSISTNTESLTSLRDKIHEGLQGKYRAYKNNAKNIALDQTRKAYSNIAASRMNDAGLDEYIWHHSASSQSPRHHHAHVLDGQTFKLSDPPVIDPKTGRRGKPGDDYNCKCYMEPVITFK